jgi:hypothetical protein
MPICIEAVSLDKYLLWLSEQLDNSPPPLVNLYAFSIFTRVS